MRKLITKDYLLSLSCETYIQTVEFKRHNFSQGEFTTTELRECFEIEGYDHQIIVSPQPNGACYQDENDEWHETPINDNFEITHTDNWQIWINSFENHLATFHYQDEIETLLKLTDAPTNARSDSQEAS